MSYGQLEMKRAEEFARANIADLAREIVVWHNTGLLNNGTGGKLRELAELLPSEARTLALAESMVSGICLELIGSQSTLYEEAKDYVIRYNVFGDEYYLTEDNTLNGCNTIEGATRYTLTQAASIVLEMNEMENSNVYEVLKV